MQLNEIAQELDAKLPPMDTRRRLDIRALERGDYVQVLTCSQTSRVHTTFLNAGDMLSLLNWRVIRNASFLISRSVFITG